MRTISFAKLLRKAARLSGLDPDRLNPELGNAFGEWLEARLRFAWTAFPWPFLCPIEERAWRDSWDAGRFYEVGEEVAFVNSDGETEYFTAISPTQGFDPEADPEGWEALETTDRFIALEQIRKTPFEDVLGVWRDDPRKVRSPRKVPYWIGEDRVQLDRCAPATVFVQFRKLSLRLTGEAWDASVNYELGDVVYFGGECYVAQAGDEPHFLITGDGTLERQEPTENVPIAGRYLPDVVINGKTSYAMGDLVLKSVASLEFGPAIWWQLSLTGGFGDDYWQGGSSEEDPTSTLQPYLANGGGALGSLDRVDMYTALAGPRAGLSPASHPAKWRLQAIPYLLAEYAARAAKADYLADDGQDDKSFAQDRRAVDWLELQMVNFTATQNHTANYSVK